jgi:hypothetical protein
MRKKLINKNEKFPLNYHNMEVSEHTKKTPRSLDDAFSVNVPKIQNSKALYLLFYKNICNF